MPKILLIITGSVAAYKALDLIAELQKRGHDIDVIQTKSAQNFVNKSEIEYLINKEVYDNLWSQDESLLMHHINLTRANDYILVYPLTADFLNKIASGFADNLALATILASDKKVIFMPAMNSKMYNNFVTQDNIKKLIKYGHIFIGPDNGMLACGEEGPGRVVDWKPVLAKINELEKFRSKVLGKNILVTAGATIEAIDPVRYISNYSSGIQGYQIARSFSDLGARVTFIHGKIDVPIDCEFSKVIEALSARDMRDAVLANCVNVDLAILSAAVADYAPKSYQSQKMKKLDDQNEISLSFVKNPDILKELSSLRHKPEIIIGFAAESNNLVENAKLKLARKGCDYILANDISANQIFGSKDTKITFVAPNYCKDWPEMPKSNVASYIINEIL
ncbi:MAG: bifunctional phosphopantothenoylcysteine decarboxylase/phosphopantothenate--cysteine ligase CoaBC [Rickettsiales bacterium]|jgi:phosphopantothenoylcysteine decarboxylase / phosphopantothenate---cysteine ligase|nr:bifunctional phosphopantothenoylcysteine decarboxylase/phosphopantothenate--cysteine ligase CoaBC [Rickettsiales bacterium]